MKISSDNAVMSPIPLNTSRFYRFHYSMTTKFSFRLIISAKRMKFTALIILLALKIPARAVINTKSDITTNLPALTTSLAVSGVMMAGIFTYHVLSVIESLNMLKTSLSVSRSVYAGRMRHTADDH